MDTERLRFMLITNRQLCKPPMVEVVKQALKGGVQAVQLREKDMPTKELFALAKDLRAATAEAKALFIVNDRVDIALAAEADGVHLGWQSLPPGIVRKLVGPDRLIGMSAHNLSEAQHAEAADADYIIFGPIYRTPSKEGIVEPTGPGAVAELKKHVSTPVVAVGGIKAENVADVLASGADGIAVLSGIVAAENPEEAAQALWTKIRKEG